MRSRHSLDSSAQHYNLIHSITNHVAASAVETFVEEILLKKYQITFVVLLALAAAFTVGCGDSSKVPTFTKMPFISNRTVDPATPLFVANLDGTNVTGIVTNSDGVYSPSISADLKVVAYSSASEIWVTNATGSTPVQLTNNVANNFYSFYVKVSPNGSKLLYSRYDGTTWHIRTMNPDGTSDVDLTPTLPSGMTQCYSGSFSADGSMIVFTCDGQSTSGVYLMKADGSSVTTVFTENGFLDSALLTPDGSKVIFVDYNNGPVADAARRNLKIFPHRAFHPQVVADSPAPFTGLVSVNPDGTGMATVAANAYEGIILNSNLYYTIYDSNLSFDQIYKSNLDGSSAVSISDGTSDDYLGVSAD